MHEENNENGDRQVKLMEANIGFISFPKLFEIVSEKSITGEIEIKWNNESERLRESIADGRIPPVTSDSGIGRFFISDGMLVHHAEITSKQSADEDVFKILIQLVFGIGCGVLPGTPMSVYETVSDVEKLFGKKKYNLIGLIKYLRELELNTNYPDFAPAYV